MSAWWEDENEKNLKIPRWYFFNNMEPVIHRQYIFNCHPFICSHLWCHWCLKVVNLLPSSPSLYYSSIQEGFVFFIAGVSFEGVDGGRYLKYFKSLKAEIKNMTKHHAKRCFEL